MYWFDSLPKTEQRELMEVLWWNITSDQQIAWKVDKLLGARDASQPDALGWYTDSDIG